MHVHVDGDNSDIEFHESNRVQYDDDADHAELMGNETADNDLDSSSESSSPPPPISPNRQTPYGGKRRRREYTLNPRAKKRIKSEEIVNCYVLPLFVHFCGFSHLLFDLLFNAISLRFAQWFPIPMATVTVPVHQFLS